MNGSEHVLVRLPDGHVVHASVVRWWTSRVRVEYASGARRTVRVAQVVRLEAAP